MNDKPAATVGETRTRLGVLLGVPRERIHHYVIVADTDDGTILKFCCDDRREAARFLTFAARQVVSQSGELMREDGAMPPMPAVPAAAPGPGTDGGDQT